MFGQAPFARLVDNFPTEGTLFCADDESAVLKLPKCAVRCGVADVQVFAGLANAVGNVAVVSPVVLSCELYVERPRIAGEALPCSRVDQPMSKPDEGRG